ncbi:hypothetical protein GCM10023190_12700 [Enteractinococcus fodinae]|uniref:hypothetical protein n=1 Tax=Enteractinococcus fodinae TaxID=684663 RepID=UPI0031F19866
MPNTAAGRSPVVRRPGFWALIAAGVLILAGAVIVFLNSTVYNPESAAEEYVEALRAGDGATAMAVSQGYLAEDAPETISTVLLDGEPLAAASAMLEQAEIDSVDAEVPDSYREPETTQRVVEIRYRDGTDQPQTTSLVVDKVGTSWGVFNEWQLHPLPLQQIELLPTQMPDNSKADEPVAHIHDAPTPLLGTNGAPATLAAFAPALIELEYDGTYLEVEEPVHFAVTDVLAAGARVEFGFEVNLTQAVDEAITEEVQQELQRCTQQTVLKPAGCPFGYETANRVVPDSVAWSIDVPDVQYSWEDSEPAIERVMATAHLSAQEIHIGTGQQSAVDYEEVFEMSADLELTPEYIRVRPNWQ